MRERVRARGRRLRGGADARRAWRRCSSATTPPRRSTSRNKQRGLRGGRDRLVPPRAWRRRRRGGAAGAGRARSAPTTSVDGILVQLPLPDQIDPDAGRSPRSTRQGRRRADARSTPACSPTARPALGALHAGRGDGAAARTRGSSWRAPRRSWSAARSWSACRSRALLLAANATVTVCHSRTRDLAAVCRRGRRAVAAVGVPRLLGADAVKPGAVGDRRRHEPDRGRALSATSTSTPRPSGRRGDHAGSRRRRADDDRDAAGQHPGRRPARGCRVGQTGQVPTTEGCAMDVDKLSTGEKIAEHRRSCSSSSCSSTGSASGLRRRGLLRRVDAAAAASAWDALDFIPIFLDARDRRRARRRLRPAQPTPTRAADLAERRRRRARRRSPSC